VCGAGSQKRLARSGCYSNKGRLRPFWEKERLVQDCNFFFANGSMFSRMSRKSVATVSNCLARFPDLSWHRIEASSTCTCTLTSDPFFSTICGITVQCWQQPAT
jgi:hypothetical protein